MSVLPPPAPYTVFASEVFTDVMKSVECRDIDQAVQLCVDLYRKGHRIHKIVLPNGAPMYQEQIEGAIREALRDRWEASRIRDKDISRLGGCTIATSLKVQSGYYRTSAGASVI